MAKHTHNVLPPFDFTPALSLTVEERFARSIDRARDIVAHDVYQELSDFPCIPDRGATAAELAELATELGVPLPTEYANFLQRWRYLKLSDGWEVGGFDHEGLHVAAQPWVSDEHRPGSSYLVFADYWRFADGDQLMFSLDDHSVVAYLHEHRPLIEPYAPTFSLALWRLVHEDA